MPEGATAPEGRERGAVGKPGRRKRSEHREAEGYSRAFNHLCHTVSLTRTGKTLDAIDSLVATVFVVHDGKDLETAQDIDEALDGWFGISLSPADVQRSVDRHQSAGRLKRDRRSGRLLLDPVARAEIQQRIDDGHQLEEAVKKEWAEDLAAHGRTAGEIYALWYCLRAYMAKAFLEHGALAVQLLDPQFPATDADGLSRSACMDQAIAESCVGLDVDAMQSEVSAFFDDPSVTRARYVAQLLDGTFTFFALTVNDATAAYLRDNLEPLKLFLDTNFIFGLLDLHENPMSEVSKELLIFIKDRGFPYTLHYHERTLREIQHTVDAISHRLTQRSWSQSISRAATRLPWMSGIELAYHKLNAESPLDAKVFLSKFQHMEELLADQEIRIYRPPPNDNDVETKGLLIAEYLRYVETRRPQSRPYEAADHDITVWLTLQRLRKRGRSALDIGALFLSADNLLSRFDWNVLRKKDEVGTVVFPAQLLQVLRPYGTTTEDYDRKFVEAFSIPEFRSAHSDYRETSGQVLSYLTTYKDLSEETAVRILTNEMLINQLRGIEEASPEFQELVESALASDNELLIEEAEAARTEAEAERCAREFALEESEARIQEKDEEAKRLRCEADERVKAARAEERELAEVEADRIRAEDADRLKAEEERRLAAEADAKSLRDQGEADALSRQARMRTWRRVGAALLWMVGATAMLVVPHITSWKWLLKHDHLPGIYVAAFFIWGGMAGTIAEPRHKKVALGALALAAAVAMISVL